MQKWEVKIPGVTGKFGLGVQNEAGQTPFSNNTREDSTHGHHQMVNTKIRLIIYFLQLEMEKLYTVNKNKNQQKQD